MIHGAAHEARQAYEEAFLAAIMGHERSQQRVIGPSGIGTPCGRKLAYSLAQAECVRDPESELRATVGTGFHLWHDNAFTRFGGEDWLTEHRVTVGDIVTPSGRTPLRGTADLFHKPTGTVIDLKVPGKTTMDKARRLGPGQTYGVQLQCYGLGFENAGFNVRNVAISMIPAGQEWKNRIWWSEPYDRRIAQAALDRASRILTHVEQRGLEATLEDIAPVDDYCHRCPYARPAPGRPTCPTAEPEKRAVRTLDQLMAGGKR